MVASNAIQSSELISTVEKAELVAAIGREIHRIDQATASQGYTSWALWAAIGVIGWKVIELMELGGTSDCGILYFGLVCALIAARALVRIIISLKGKGPLTFRSSEPGSSGAISAWIACAVLLLLIAIRLDSLPRDGYQFWITLGFLVFPVFSLLVVAIAPKLPTPELDGMGRKGVLRFSALFMLAWSGAGFVSAFFALFPFGVDYFLVPSNALKISILLTVLTVLIYRLAQNLKAGERRTVFQRLETELTLSKIGAEEAQNRYEVLMLGMNVAAAFRPWIDAATAPLDNASASLSEAKHLIAQLNSVPDRELSDAEIAVENALGERVSQLIEGVSVALKQHRIAYGRLRGFLVAFLGETDLSRSAMALEHDQLLQARARVESALVEVRELLK